MNLTDMANYVTTQVGLVDTDDVAAAQLFLRNFDELLYNSYLWKDSFIGTDISFDPTNPDNAEGVLVVPSVISMVLAARVASAPGVWGNSLRIHGMEDYYRVDWDWFSQQGTPWEFAEMTPIWFINRTGTGLQLVNLNIADSGTQCEVTWYDDTQVKHVQLITPGSQLVAGADIIGEPPVPVAVAPPTVTPPPAAQDLISEGDYGGNAPPFTPSYGVGMATDTGPLGGNRRWEYYAGAWH